MDEEIPQEIRNKIKNSLNKSGKVRQFEEKLSSGVKKAIIHLQTGKETISVNNQFDQASEDELLALQYIYSYLQKKNLAYTLSTILLESRIKENNNNGQYSLTKVIEYISNPSEEEEIDDKIFENHLDQGVHGLTNTTSNVTKSINQTIPHQNNNDSNDILIDSDDEEFVETDFLTPQNPTNQIVSPKNNDKNDDDDILIDSDDDFVETDISTPKNTTNQKVSPKNDDKDDDDFLLESDDGNFVQPNVSSTTVQRPSISNENDIDDNIDFEITESDDEIIVQPKISNPKVATTKNTDDFDEFDDLSDDYVAQGEEITQEEFNKNTIISKISDL